MPGSKRFREMNQASVFLGPYSIPRLLNVILNQSIILFSIPFPEKFGIYHQQSKGFSFFFGSFGVVRAMGAKDSPTVEAVKLFEPGETTVDIYVVDEEIGEAVKGNTHANEKHPEIWR
jgi:hypothetical protein